MKYLSLFLLSTLLLFSCSSGKDDINVDAEVLGSRIKPFSSCEEIEGIVTDLLYNNRDLIESKINADKPYSFRCVWEQEQTYDPNDMFFVRKTEVRTNYDLAHMTREELSKRLVELGSEKMKDPRLNHSQYDNIIISKSFNKLLNANTYTAYVWGKDERIDRIIIEDTNWTEHIPELLENVAVVDMFIQMLEPVD